MRICWISIFLALACSSTVRGGTSSSDAGSAGAGPSSGGEASASGGSGTGGDSASGGSGTGGDSAMGGSSAGGASTTTGGSTAGGQGGAASETCSGDDTCPGPAGICDNGICVSRGPDMVEVELSTGTFWIDSTEVTRAHYRAFLDAKGDDTSGQPSVCSWNTSYDPDADLVPDNLPVAAVDWCDARAYCEWAGKRLCGKVGGGSVNFEEAFDPELGQWYRACGGSSERYYPYGFTFAPGRCNDETAQRYEAVEVASMTECEGSYGGIFDMTGNVIEWIDSCEAETGAMDECMIRGGSHISTEQVARCTTIPTASRDSRGPVVGVRCCSR